MNTLSGQQFNQPNNRDFHKNPFFYFGSISFVLLCMLFFSSSSLAQLNSLEPVVLSGASLVNADNGDVYVNQNSSSTLETPDLKIGGDFVYGVATTHVFSTQTLGAVMGGQDSIQSRSETQDYDVEVGDSPQSIADKFGLSLNTILWANDLSKSSTLKTGRTLVIPQADGLLYAVKSGDTLEGIATKYKVDVEDIMDANGLADSQVFFGDIFFLPGAKPVVSAKTPVSIAASVTQTVLPDSFFIFPLLKFKITQGLHYYNGVDISSLDGAGSPVYAAAGGVVQHADYDKTGGNRVTILHDNGVVTYYGHLGSMMVRPGQPVTQGQQIGSEGQTGKATGPHVHFQVMGAANFIAKYYKPGTPNVIDVTKK